MLVLIRFCFNLNFHDLVIELYLRTTYFDSGSILDGFMVLDIDNYMLSNTNDSCYSMMTISWNTCDNVTIWHARLRHIEQEKMNRLDRGNIIGQFTKLICQLVNIV